MADAALTVIDGIGDPQDLLVAESAGSTLTPYHKEDTTQRAALITTLTGGAAKFVSANPATIYTDQQAVTATAVALTAQAMVNGFVLKASPLNVIPVFVGGAGVTAANDGTGSGYPLSPGEAISFGVTNTSAVYVIASTTGAFVSVAGN